jgi:hypothetical protein
MNTNDPSPFWCSCPSCGHEFNFAPELAGAEIPCPRCQQTVELRKISEVEEAAMPARQVQASPRAHAASANKKGGGGCIMVIVIFVLAIYFLAPVIAPIQITGKIYVVTRGRSVVNMPSVEVLAYQRESLLKTVQGLNTLLADSFRRFKSDSATKDLPPDKLQREWVEMATPIVARTVKTSYQDRAITDSEGKFGFRLKNRGPWCFIAISERMVGATEEKYVWARNYTDKCNRFYSYTVDMTNEQDLHTDEILDQDFFLVQFLRNNFGLKLNQGDF